MGAVIFLDIDGVLNSVANGCRGLDPANVAHLNDLVERTGAHVVVSSTWRHSGLSAMRETLAGAGFRGKVIGVTPYLPRVDRGDEIELWMRTARARPTAFVILDDDADMGRLLPHLVRTDHRVGLAATDVDAAEAILARLAPVAADG